VLRKRTVPSLGQGLEEQPRNGADYDFRHVEEPEP
jgi:hypothetical protein